MPDTDDSDENAPSSDRGNVAVAVERDGTSGKKKKKKKKSKKGKTSQSKEQEIEKVPDRELAVEMPALNSDEMAQNGSSTAEATDGNGDGDNGEEATDGTKKKTKKEKKKKRKRSKEEEPDASTTSSPEAGSDCVSGTESQANAPTTGAEDERKDESGDNGIGDVGGDDKEEASDESKKRKKKDRKKKKKQKRSEEEAPKDSVSSKEANEDGVSGNELARDDPSSGDAKDATNPSESVGDGEEDDDELLAAAAAWAGDDEGETPTTDGVVPRKLSLHITQLPYDANELDLRQLFMEQDCAITSIRLVYDRDLEGRKTVFRGVAFVDFADQGSYDRARKLHHRTSIRGRKLNIRPCRSREELAEIVARTELLVREKIRKQKELGDRTQPAADAGGGGSSDKKRSPRSAPKPGSGATKRKANDRTREKSKKPRLDKDGKPVKLTKKERNRRAAIIMQKRRRRG